ncbi:MAG: hypothetical protein KJN93_04645 [Alphaproteobacteria bacterium]|nr:hypothetical protein [Alphaproteobacteria bacterium]NNF25092.1 hypothetical protein [Paracoccaceae bacterium]
MSEQSDTIGAREYAALQRQIVIELWQIQEKLLQSYRTIFIAFKTLLLSAALLLINNEDATLLSQVFIIVAGSTAIYFWSYVTRARAGNVTLLQAMLYALEKGVVLDEDYHTQMLAYQKLGHLRPRVAKAMQDVTAEYPLEKHGARLVLSNLPLVFLGFWGVVILNYIYTYYVPVSILCRIFRNGTPCIAGS